MAKGKAKSHLGALLLLLGLLCGYGYWNYQRNVEAEARIPRPYKTYSDAQLEQLLSAYEGQAGELANRYDAVAAKRSRSHEVGLVGEGIDQFERVQAASRRVRELGAQASQEAASVAQIRQEQALRAKWGSGAMAFLRRAFMPPS